MLHPSPDDQLPGGGPYGGLRAPFSSSVAMEVSSHGCGQTREKWQSLSKMKLGSGFWSYTGEMESEVWGRGASIGINEDTRAKDLGTLDTGCIFSLLLSRR